MAKLVFMGTPEIAVPTLTLLHNQFDVTAVVSVPDKPQGRGMRLKPSPIKQQAEALNIEVLQPASLTDSQFVERLKQIDADIFVVFAFRFLPKEVYNLAKIASFNVHTSLLPDYRGAAPINWAIINGETTSGLTAFILNDKIDAGYIISQQQIAIPQYCTAGTLQQIMASEAPIFTAKVCDMLIANNYTKIEQHGIVSTKIAPKIYKNTAEIDWNQFAQNVVNFINGYSPQPCAWTKWGNSKLQILHAKMPAQETIDKCAKDIAELKTNGEYRFVAKKMLVKCGDGNVIEVLEVKPENKRRMKVEDFINGRSFKLN